jgi:hypothetical protein
MVVAGMDTLDGRRSMASVKYDLEKAALLGPLTIAPLLPKLERQLLVLPAQWRGLSRVGIAS